MLILYFLLKLVFINYFTVTICYDDSNKISLKNSRPYMQQIQHQMFATGNCIVILSFFSEGVSYYQNYERCEL